MAGPMADPSAMHEPSVRPEPRPEPPRRRPFRIWRLALVLFLLVVALVIAAPWLIDMDSVRARLERHIGEASGSTCRIGTVDFGWLSGISVRDLTIENAPGFPASHPFVHLQGLRGDVGLLGLLRGRVGFEGRVEGLRVHVDQDANGRTNVETLLERSGLPREPEGAGEGGNVRIEHRGAIDLGWLRLELAVTGASIEYRREGELVEAVTDASARIDKPFGDDRISFTLDARTLPPPGGGATPGQLRLRGYADAATTEASFEFDVEAIDLGRYEPLARRLLAEGALTRLAGVVSGSLRGSVDLQRTRRIRLDGDVAIAGPALAGGIVSGMAIEGERWTAQPQLTIELDERSQPTRIVPAGFAIDLGFATLHALDDVAVGKALDGAPGIGCSFAVDLDRLAAFGGPMPAQLQGSDARLAGTAALPLAGTTLPDAGRLAALVRVAAELQIDRVALRDLELAGLAANLDLREGAARIDVAPGATLGGGPIALQVRSDVRDLATARADIACDWRSGQVGATASSWLRYLVPLLAGLDADAARFEAALDLQANLSGPIAPSEGQNWLQWLDAWQGDGAVHLANGKLRPAPALAGLLSPLEALLGRSGGLGAGGELAIDDLQGAFRVQQGHVESTAMRWLAAGKTIGLSGRVSLAGQLDYGIDLTALLRDHRDGARLVQALGDKTLTAGLSGTVDAPRLSLPDPQRLLRSVLQGSAEDIVRKSLEDLLRGKKKD